MTEETFNQELLTARQHQASAEFARELAGQIVGKVAGAVQALPLDILRIFDGYIDKSLELVGVDYDEAEP